MTIPLSEAREPFILSLDLGSSSIRAGLFDGEARQIEGLAGKVNYRLRVDDSGAADTDPIELIETAGRAIDDVLAAAGGKIARIAAVASCSLVGNLLGVDASLAPTTPLYTWADTRPAADAAELRRQVDEAAWHERLGTVIHSSYLPARFLWLQRTQPVVLERTRWWMSLGEYLFLRLLGERTCSYSVASWTGLLNRHTLEWDEEVFASLPVSVEQFSPLADFGDAMRGLSAEYARRWPLLADAPWFLTVGDGVSANIGSGCDAPERAALTVGTSGAMRVVVPEVRQVPAGLWSYRVDRRRALLGGALSNGGNLFDWLQRTLNLDDLRDLDRQLQEMKPDAHGLTVLPFLAGERSPGWAAGARAAWTGLSLGTSPLEMMRAGLEAVAYRFALIYRGLRGQVPQANRFIASGGAMLASPAWTQIIADVLGAPITLCTEPEATSRGNALLALEALGAIKTTADFPAATGRTFKPDMGNHAVYQKAVARQEELYVRLIGNPQ